MANRLTVMISSTARDLPEHRSKVMEACLQQGCFPVMMEHLPASDDDAVSASLRMVDGCDIYLGLYGWRYGYEPAGHEISITEMEHDRAVERGIPRLLFIMHDEHPVRAQDVERGAGAAKLEAFKERICAQRVVNFFRSPEELRGQVVNSLSHVQSRKDAELAGSVMKKTRGEDMASDLARPEESRGGEAKRGGVTIQNMTVHGEAIFGDATIDKRTMVIQGQDGKKLEEIRAGQQTIDKQLVELRTVLLARFDIQEQRLTAVIVERLDAHQLEQVTAVVDAIEAQQTSSADNEALWANIEAMLIEIADRGERMADMQALLAEAGTAQILEGSGLDVRHRLKATIPLVPLLLSYEGEIDLGSRFDLDAAWNKLVRKIRGA